MIRWYFLKIFMKVGRVVFFSGLFCVFMVSRIMMSVTLTSSLVENDSSVFPVVGHSLHVWMRAVIHYWTIFEFSS